MSIVSGTELSKSYGPQDVFEGLSFEVPHGASIALVGSNGCGKTTLLRLIAKLEQPTAGKIHRAKRLRIGYLPQQAELNEEGTLWEAMEQVFADVQRQAERLRQLEGEMADPTRLESAMERYGPLLEAFEASGGYTYTNHIEQVLAGLGFDPDDFDQPVAHLSGGQRTRALLARLLLETPDLLLLDEPTNHLDLSGIEWLEGHLKNWPGAMVVVAHDRAFLDEVADQVWEMALGQLTAYRGNYSQYVAQREDQRLRQQALYERQQEHIARTEDYVRRYKAGQRTRQAQGREKRLARLERIERPRDEATINLDLGKPLRSGDLVLGFYDLVVGYDQTAPLFSIEELELRRGQRVALLGPNGTGKTTLLRTILGQVEPLSGRFRIGAGVHPGYFAQAHAELDRQKTVLDTIVDAGLPSVSRARTLLGRYRFSGDSVYKVVGDLSGGEQARVALAVLAMQGANLLLLDEPTNHLDIPSQEVLQEVLSAFAGTVLLVSHDRYLIRALATRVWAIAGEQLWVFGEGYDEYRAWVQEWREEVEADAADDGRRERGAERERRRAARRERERRERRRDELEETIRKVEARMTQLETELETAGTERQVEQVAELGAEYARLQSELDSHMEQWEELA
jgi:ATP-binding cassette subfamily F protein 3